MNPFLLSKKNISGAIMTTKVREPDEKPEGEESNENEGLQAAMRELTTAIQTGDDKAAAQAFQAAFQICENQPHEEIEHDNDEQEQE